ncbi:hypothetical protein CEP54_006632 [Fusarium duplospermum]|uniref:CCHC-type domain-containing protein n=1 Tax=Fusarium duplospermum TaxID=1325734 RepID=A0A428Q5S0_9HYPO|nr:hypothetical protein CEP54_006632 [Fusarium duplospermum]
MSQSETGRDRGGSASPSPDENSEDSELRRLAFMALATNALKPGSSMAKSRIRRFQDQALRALSSQVAEADGPGHGDDNLQRLAFLALASQVLKPGAADTESRIREFQDQALLAPDSPIPNSENPSTNDQGPQNEETMAPDSQPPSTDVQTTHNNASQRQYTDFRYRLAFGGDSQTEESQDEDDTIICANCERPGHKISECMIPRRDGYVHGCVFCNTTSHGTTQCANYSWDFDSQVDVLVLQRGNMPPLKDAPWRRLTREYMESSLIPFEEVFPWTRKFGKRVLKNPDLLEEAIKGIEIPGYRPVDPKTATWATIEDTIEGTPGQFKKRLMEMRWI